MKLKEKAAAIPDRLLNLFESRGALLNGHFLLSSGRHSNRYLQCALLLQDTAVAAKLGEDLAKLFPGPVDTVVSPAIGGLIIGHETARAKKARAIFSEKDDAGKPVLRRGFALAAKEKVLVVEDVITTGLSTGEVVRLVELAGAQLVGVGSLVNRSEEGSDVLKECGKPVRSLLRVEVESWHPAGCPLCKQGIPVIKPGSRKQ